MTLERKGTGEWRKGQGNVKNGKEEMSDGCEKKKSAPPDTQDLQILLECLMTEQKKIKTISKNSKKASTP